jgi:hypothetical protein
VWIFPHIALLYRPYISGWWFGTFFIFHNIWDVMLPIDELIFFKMVIAPPSRYGR